jgi:NTP pyrophosphatase (non-canonical NTP hydrolase)
MSKTIQELQDLMVDQLKRRGFYPHNEYEALLRIGEEVGELYEAVREQQDFRNIAFEAIDVLWNLLRFCEFKKIDVEKYFLEKMAYNETRERPEAIDKTR